MTEAAGGMYPDLVLTHCKHPRNRRRPTDFTRQARGENPLCGDQVEVFIRAGDGVLEDIAFDGTCCAVATASASMMTEISRGRGIDEVQRFAERFLRFTRGANGTGAEEVGPLGVFAAVCESPSRAQCAALPWQALSAALGQRTDTNSLTTLADPS